MRGEMAWSQNDFQALLVNTCTRSRVGDDWISTLSGLCNNQTKCEDVSPLTFCHRGL